MKTKQRLYTSISLGAKVASFVLLMLVTACGGQETPDVEKEDKLQLSDQEITLGVDGWKSMTSSRATIFGGKDDIEKESNNKGGGNLTLYAYLEDGTTFIGGARAKYFSQNTSWEFYDGQNLINYYWPQTGSVDFFAYMPWSGSGKQKKINIERYNKDTGALSISCQTQEPTTLDDTEGQETIIAYTANKSKADKSVNMHFVHPFAAVSFELQQAHRDLTINWIRFNDVYLKGKTTLNGTTDNSTTIVWTDFDSRSTFTIPVDGEIPDDINFGAEIGGPYLVMPQTLDGVTIDINYHWDNAKSQDDIIYGDQNNDPTDKIYEIRRSINTEWVAGKKYTYILNLGDNKEEILFQVKVEPWVSVGYDNVIDVE